MDTKLFLSKICNYGLRLRYFLFKNCITPKDFTKGNRIFYDDFKTLDNFTLTNNEFSAGSTDVWYQADAVSIVPEGVLIKSYKDVKYHESWNGKGVSTWTTGFMTTREDFNSPMGTWVVKAKPCDSWCAIWLLKRDHDVPNYTKQQIIPEADLMEVMNPKYQISHTIHYGYSDTEYAPYMINGGVIYTNDNAWHEFAVELLTDGYKFYVDGILTTILRSDNPQFVSNFPNYLILSGGANKYADYDTDFVIASVQKYE